MHISSILVENYRSFRKLVLDDLPAQIVIVGENAVGKSNLLRALRLVLDPGMPESQRYLRRDDFADGLEKPLAGDVIKVAIGLAGFDGDKDAMALLSDAMVSAKPYRARLTYVYRPRTDTVVPGNPPQYDFLIFGGDDESSVVDHDVRRSIAFHLLPALRNAEEDLQNWSRSPLRRLLESLAIPPEVLDAAQAGVEAATGTLTAHDAVKALNDSLTTRLRSMVGERFAVKSSLGVAAGRAEQLLRAIRIFVDDGAVRPIADASLGTANVVFLALLLQETSLSKAAGRSTANVLAIEEPEAHLHPHVQRVLFSSLLRDANPLLLTTHSPHIASVSRLPSIVLLRRAGKNGTVGFTAHGAGFDARETADIERYLDVTRAEMLFARGVILVEGAAEQYLVPAFARQLGVDLDQLGITVCSVQGTDFAPYCRLLSARAFAIPSVVLTDGDPGADGGIGARSGIRRGVAILEAIGADPDALAQAIDEDDGPKAREVLAQHHVLVGGTTLETDLLPGGGTAMVQAFDSLEPSPAARADFAVSVVQAGAGDGAARKRVIKRIDAVGKGRFAQKLSGQLQSVPPPDYIRGAIEGIVRLVYPDA